jgi:hypothetical protein
MLRQGLEPTVGGDLLTTPVGEAVPFGHEAGNSLGDLLQTFERTAATVRVRFETELGDAEVDIIAGRIVDAYMGEHLGRAALLVLLGVAEGRYRLEEIQAEERPALVPTIAELLTERDQRIAEWRALCEQGPQLSTVIELTAAGRLARDGQSRPKHERELLALLDGRRPLTDVIDESRLDAVAALRAIIDFQRSGLVQERPSQSLTPNPTRVRPTADEAFKPASAPVGQRPGGPARRHTAIGLGINIPVTQAPVKRAEVRRIIAITTPPPAVAPPGEPTPVMPRRRSGSFTPGPALVSPDAPPPSVSGDASPSRSTTRFIGRYEVLGRIGYGGMGLVYLCRLTSEVGFRRLVAVKMLRSHLVQDAGAAEKFLAEARLAGHMHHPNVVGVVDAGFHGAQPYLVMDYVEGASLKQLLGTDAGRRVDLILPILLDGLAGLHAAHTLESDDGTPLRVVHCDISPENLMVGVDGLCRLTDFGVARHGEAVGMERVAQGKPGYMAPEQLYGAPLDRRADIFAFGVVLYGAITGVSPFAADTIEETVHLVKTAVIPPPSTVGLCPPASFDAVCMKALQRDRELRYSTAEEMLVDLRRVALREGLLAPTSLVAEWVRQCVGPELAQRRLAALDASRGAKSPAAPGAPATFAATEETAVDEEQGFLRSRPSMSQTMVLGTSPTRRRWLLAAAVVAVVAVVSTLASPQLVSRVFRVKTQAVSAKSLELPAPPAPTGSASPRPGIESTGGPSAGQ